MPQNAYLLFGLGAAVLYAVAALMLKGASDRGAASLHTTLLANITTAIAFAFFLPWHEKTLTPAAWWPCIFEACLFFAGQLFTVLALSRGCPSISTPVLGSKVVCVALILAVVVAAPVKLSVWVAALLITGGIALLARSTGEMHRSGRIATFTYAFLAALSFAAFDVMTQVWSPRLTFARFMPWSMFIAAALTLVILPLKDRRLPHISAKALPHALGGSVMLTVQSMLLIWAVGRFGDAAGLNVVYGSRGIWSVLAVWLAGVLAQRRERTPHAIFVQRLAAACLIAAAVGLAFWRF